MQMAGRRRICPKLRLKARRGCVYAAYQLSGHPLGFSGRGGGKFPLFEHMDNSDNPEAPAAKSDQFCQWLVETKEEDQWWLCLDGVVEQVPLSLLEIEGRLEAVKHTQALLLHVSKANTQDRVWSKIPSYPGQTTPTAFPTPLVSSEPPSNESAEEESSPSSSHLERRAFKGERTFVLPVILLLVAVVILWNFWLPILYITGFFGTWILVAYLGIRSKKSEIASIGGGLILGTLVWLMLHKVFGASEAKYTGREFEPATYTGHFEPAPAYSPPEVNPRSKTELLALFDELQAFRDSPDFHEYGFSRLGKINWMDRLKQLQEWEAKAQDSESYAAASLETLGMNYLRSKGQETDFSRLNRESMEEHLGAPQLVTERRHSDFEKILSGTDETVIGNISVINLGDLIAETMGERINWMLSERVLIDSKLLDARLVNFDDGYLYYVTPDSEGRLIPFALRRTPDIEEKRVKGYATQRERYEALIRGDAASVDPLKKGYLLVTSRVTNFDFSKEKKILNDYHKATHGKLAELGFEICCVRVIVLD